MKSCTELIDGFPVNFLAKKVIGKSWGDYQEIEDEVNFKNSRERRMEARKIKHVQIAIDNGVSISSIEQTKDLDASNLLRKLKQ
jgi:hypothetical protein